MDGMTDYYDVSLKRGRLAGLMQHPGFSFAEFMLEDAAWLSQDIAEFRPDAIVHLAAQAACATASKRRSHFSSSNIEGTFNMIEAARTPGSAISSSLPPPRSSARIPTYPTGRRTRLTPRSRSTPHQEGH
ncbi:MAG: NAD-dependent epimerase/dehydratase family protein [Defluviimonas denitrificans]